ncbi:MAG TPA: hypothetical protein VEU33_19545 [Archangium sp.]|nr:hypothetical protein [Archangium sp.]
MNDTFDSHEVIRHIMRAYPKEYVRELYSRVLLPDPILTTHAEIGRALGRLEMIEKTNRVDSRNVRGEMDTENQGWRKLRRSA